MSVPPGNRNKSSMQFLETADRIESRAMDVCRKWPKSWWFVITARTITLASQIYEHALKANAIFPIVTEEERQERILELQRAMGANYAFARKIERAYSKFPLCGEKDRASAGQLNDKSNKLLEEFMTLCATEDDALKGNISWTRSVELVRRKPEKTGDTEKAAEAGA